MGSAVALPVCLADVQSSHTFDNRPSSGKGMLKITYKTYSGVNVYTDGEGGRGGYGYRCAI